MSRLTAPPAGCKTISVTANGPKLVGFVVSIRGAQRFRIGLPVNAHGLIDNIRAQELTPIVSPASVIPALAPGWVAQPVTFEAGGVTIYGTYTHPGGTAAGTVPAAVLLTCSHADNYFGCGEVGHLAAGLSKASARLDYVHLNGVDHFLEDISRNPADWNQSLPFSARLRAALKTFLARNL